MPQLTVVVEAPDGSGKLERFEDIQQTNKMPMEEGKFRLGRKIGVKRAQWRRYDVLVGGPDGPALDWTLKTTQQDIISGTVLYLKLSTWCALGLEHAGSVFPWHSLLLHISILVFFSSTRLAEPNTPKTDKKRRKSTSSAAATPGAEGETHHSRSASSECSDSEVRDMLLSSIEGPVVLEGPLTKRGHKRKNWKRRVFALHGAHAVSYRAKRKDAKIKGIIRLAGAELIASLTLKKAREHTFGIVEADGTEFFLAAESAEVRAAWLEALASALAASAKQLRAADADRPARLLHAPTPGAAARLSETFAALANSSSSGFGAALNQSGASATAAADAGPQAAAEPLPVPGEDDDPYAIGAILGVRMLKKKIQYLISFRFLGPENNTWEDEDALEGVEDLIAEFHVRQDAEYMVRQKRSRTMTLADWDLLGTLGQGGYGRVDLCRLKSDTAAGRLNNLYAIKILNKAFLLDRDEVEHTRTEALVLQSVHHPFIVSMHFAFQSPEHLFFVMDYVDGGDLVKFWQASGCAFAESRARFYAAQVLLALAHLHRHGIVHRDIKMENLLLDAAGNVLVTDFGLAKTEMDEGATTRTLCGTLACLAPEIVQSEPYGKAVDWWSFGVTLYQMVASQLPFPATDRLELFNQILACQVSYPAHFSAELCSLLAGLLRRDPAERLTADAIHEHVWFSSIDFDLLYRRKLPPPFVPPASAASRADAAMHRVHSLVHAGGCELSDVQQRLFRGFSYSPADFAASASLNRQRLGAVEAEQAART